METHKLNQPGPTLRMTNPTGISIMVDPIGSALRDLEAPSSLAIVQRVSNLLLTPSCMVVVTPMKDMLAYVPAQE